MHAYIKCVSYDVFRDDVGSFSNFYASQQVVLFAALTIAIVPPPLLVFALSQRSFTAGLTVGASRY